VASALSDTQSLAHAAVARGPIWLCAFVPAVLHGCTPLVWSILISVSTSIGTKKGRNFMKGKPFNGAPQTFWGPKPPPQLPQTTTPGSATVLVPVLQMCVPDERAHQVNVNTTLNLIHFRYCFFRICQLNDCLWLAYTYLPVCSFQFIICFFLAVQAEDEAK